jgi:hypothetical protein
MLSGVISTGGIEASISTFQFFFDNMANLQQKKKSG